MRGTACRYAYGSILAQLEGRTNVDTKSKSNELLSEEHSLVPWPADNDSRQIKSESIISPIKHFGDGDEGSPSGRGGAGSILTPDLLEHVDYPRVRSLRCRML